ncbi:MAG TPA: SDR family NAD(P)-dependent oxidoreductase, partial [Chloroflexota bacterium]|nr:SDR family NAD(P)-dependent oxidoreductase [Chloroflexota bacterium]
MIVPGERFEQQDTCRYRLDPAAAGDYQRLLDAVAAEGLPPCRGIVHLWSLDAAPMQETSLASLEAAHRLGYRSVLFLVQALARATWSAAPRLWLVTRGAQAPATPDQVVEVAQSPLCGFARTIANEYPELRCTTVDLDARPEARHAESPVSLAEELWADSAESQVALRREGRYAARLVRCAAKSGPPQSERHADLVTVRVQDQPFRVETRTPGILDNLTLQAVTRQEPGPGEVELEVAAVGLNFMNVMAAMGILPGYADGVGPLGIECAGTIVRLGTGIERLHVGESVMALAYSCLGTHAMADARLVVARPAQLDSEEAATIPVAFLTAYYALHHLARMGPGDRVLIHSATGGVGIAAIQLARRVGAEIFATAGTPEKRAMLQSLGVAHAMDSRSLDFAVEVMKQTGDQGVDIVLNSLAGEAIAASLSVLAPYGRFVELGKRDIYQNSRLGLWPFHKNLSYFAVDLDRMSRERPALLSTFLREIAGAVAGGDLQPLPHQVYPIAQVADAFRQMAQARHIGKVVISLPARDQEVLVHPLDEGAPARFRSEGTYVITGGLGGLGLTVARWLVEQGARHLVLVGRRGIIQGAEDPMRQLERAGARVKVARVDVAEERQVRGLLDEIEQTMPPLCGIFHAAAVLDDATLSHLDEDRCRRVAMPKIDGAWNLHTLTLNQPLDHFVLFSSVASLLGSPAQGNYVAANAFLDALAHHRRACGLPALSINWGPWAEVGLAAAQANRGERLATRGIGSIMPEQGVEALRMALEQNLPQVGVMPFDPAQWIQFYPAAASDPLLAQLALDREDAPRHVVAGSALRETLLAARAEDRLALLEEHLREQVAHVLRLDPERVDA